MQGLGETASSENVVHLCRLRLEKLETKKRQTETRICELDQKIDQGESATNEMKRVHQSLDLFKKTKKSGNRKTLKRVIHKIFTVIQVDAGRLGLGYWTTSTTDLLGFEETNKKAWSKTLGPLSIFPQTTLGMNRPVFCSLRKMVGIAGFEPATPCTPCKCASQAALYPDHYGGDIEN